MVCLETVKTLMIFVDGLGMGEEQAPEINPLYGGACPHLRRLLDEHAKPIDACLGVEGAPQSATGQTSLLTGINAPEAIGRHLEGFPHAALKDIIRPHNIFSRLRERGYRATFANAYYIQGLDEGVVRRYQSVTTVATLAAFGGVRDRLALVSNRAVYQDLTREALRRRGYDGPLVTPEEAAGHLLNIAEEHDFTLFEYFQTDLAAHRAKRDVIDNVLRTFDAFLGRALSFADEPGRLFLLTSDHGNIEDARTRRHTLNPVPFIARGAHAEALKANVDRLTDIVPALTAWYPERA